MNWQETVIQNKDLKWKRPPIKYIEDDKVDIQITIPLTSVVEGQAQKSFACGVIAAINFFAEYQKNERKIETIDIVGFLNECGLPWLAEKIEQERGAH